MELAESDPFNPEVQVRLRAAVFQCAFAAAFGWWVVQREAQGAAASEPLVGGVQDTQLPAVPAACCHSTLLPCCPAVLASCHTCCPAVPASCPPPALLPCCARCLPHLPPCSPACLSSQRRLMEAIEQKNVHENMELALEHNPEAFSSVCML